MVTSPNSTLQKTVFDQPQETSDFGQLNHQRYLQ